MDLFAELETPQAVDTETGEVNLFGDELPTENVEQMEAKMAAAREALGISKQQSFIETIDDVKRALKKRLHIVAELAEAKKYLAKIEQELNSWTYVYEKQCEAFLAMNPPKKGSTLHTEVGSLSFRNVGASYALDKMADPDEKKFSDWLNSLDPKLKEKYKLQAEVVTVFKRDMKAIKDDLLAQYEKDMTAWAEACAIAREQKKELPPRPIAPIVPGLRFTAPHKSFSIKQGEK